MPAKKIKITFDRVLCLRNQAWFGPSPWVFNVQADGQTIGDPATVFSAKEGKTISLGWSKELDVSGKKPGDTLTILFKTIEKGVFAKKPLGEIKLVLAYPFEREIDLPLYGSVVKSRRHFKTWVQVRMTEGEHGGGPVSDVPVARQHHGGETFTTLTGEISLPRFEICPVVPTMAADQMPKRPNFQGLVSPGKNTAHGKVVVLSGDLPLNRMANPSLIPILSPSDKDFQKKAARIAVTYLEPRDADLSKLRWRVQSGPVKLHGATDGKLEVLAYGTGDGKTDELAVIELRWENEHGPLLSTFRAYVGHVRYVPYRANVIVGTNDDAAPRPTNADVASHIHLANVMMYQSGLLLVPDLDCTTWDGAVVDPDHPGIYRVKVTDNSLTVGVALNLPPNPLRLNFRPGVMHICYIKSFADNADGTKDTAVGVATDRPGLSGAHVTLDGAPTSSWLSPSGVPPDDAAQTVKMLTMPKSKDRSTKADQDYLKTRPDLTAADYQQLYGVIMPDYTKGNDPDWPQTVAHEVGHVLGLRHRGNPQTTATKLGSNDEVNDPKGKGHPWHENVMSYGGDRSLDFDLIQTMVIRKHPTTHYPPPTPPKPKPPTPPTKSKLVLLQEILGVPTTDVWDVATEQAASSNMVRYGSKGKVVEWVQERLNEAGMNSGEADGISGSITVGAIRRYQDSKEPLTTDGVAGPRTMQHLAEAV